MSIIDKQFKKYGQVVDAERIATIDNKVANNMLELKKKKIFSLNR